ncbi:MAG: ATP-binding cassette domain-containing protein [Microbacterium sp.]
MTSAHVENSPRRFRTILDQVNRRPGESVAIVDGSGKSTLLNIVGLLESPTSGAILVGGKRLPRINSHAASALRRDRINYLFQSFALINFDRAAERLIGMHSVNGASRRRRSRSSSCSHDSGWTTWCTTRS